MESEAKQASMKGKERVQQDKTPQDSRLHANVDTLPLQSQQASVSNNSIRDVVANESSEPLVPEQQLTKLTENTAPLPQPQDSLQVLFSPPTKESSSSSMTVNTASVTSSPGRVTAAALTGGRCTSNATAKRRRGNQAEEAALVAAVQSVFAATGYTSAGAVVAAVKAAVPRSYIVDGYELNAPRNIVVKPMTVKGSSNGYYKASCTWTYQEPDNDNQEEDDQQQNDDTDEQGRVNFTIGTGTKPVSYTHLTQPTKP